MIRLPVVSFTFLTLVWMARSHINPDCGLSDDDDLELKFAYPGYKESHQYPSKEAGRRVAEWTPAMNIPPWVLGTYYQGDIMVPINRGRDGLRGTSRRWPNGIVPYEFGPNNFTTAELGVIYSAMSEYLKYTCVKFVPRTTEADYLLIANNDTGCWSYVGRLGVGPQLLNLQSPGCVSVKSTAMHEMMHALGFMHEQSRTDRDSYIKIIWANIQNGMASQFDMDDDINYTNFSLTYDCSSVMQYPWNAFSVDLSLPTMVAINPSTCQMNYPVGFTKNDIMAINIMYNCTNMNDIVNKFISDKIKERCP